MQLTINLEKSIKGIAQYYSSNGQWWTAEDLAQDFRLKVLTMNESSNKEVLTACHNLAKDKLKAESVRDHESTDKETFIESPQTSNMAIDFEACLDDITTKNQRLGRILDQQLDGIVPLSVKDRVYLHRHQTEFGELNLEKYLRYRGSWELFLLLCEPFIRNHKKLLDDLAHRELIRNQ